MLSVELYKQYNYKDLPNITNTISVICGIILDLPRIGYLHNFYFDNVANKELNWAIWSKPL